MLLSVNQALLQDESALLESIAATEFVNLSERLFVGVGETEFSAAKKEIEALLPRATLDYAKTATSYHLKLCWNMGVISRLCINI